MCATNEGTNHAQHLLQQYLQRRLQKDFDCIGNGFYFQKNIFKEVEDCCIYLGYKMTPLINTNKIYMKIDPTFRVIRHENFLTTLKRFMKEEYIRF